GDRHRLPYRAGDAHPREVLVAAQLGQDDGDLRVADVGPQLVLDVAGDVVRRAAAGGHVADQGDRDLAVGTDGDGDAQFRVAPDRNLDFVVHADQVVADEGLLRGRRSG